MWVVKKISTGEYSALRKTNLGSMVDDINKARTFNTRASAVNHKNRCFGDNGVVLQVELKEVPDNVDHKKSIKRAV